MCPNLARSHSTIDNASAALHGPPGAGPGAGPGEGAGAGAEPVRNACVFDQPLVTSESKARARQKNVVLGLRSTPGTIVARSPVSPTTAIAARVVKALSNAMWNS